MTDTSTLQILTPAQIEKLKIQEKIFRVQQEIKALIKDEKNASQNYKYFEEEQILKVLKPLLGKYGLLMEISDNPNEKLVYEREIVQTQKGQRIIHYLKYLKTLKITNINNDAEERIFNFWACGSNDDLAKAKGSSETYAMKYILSKYFLIRVLDENDPELSIPVEVKNKELTAEEKAQVEEVLKRHNLKGNAGTTTLQSK